VRSAHCQLLSLDANEMILRSADFRYPKLAVKANFCGNNIVDRLEAW